MEDFDEKLAAINQTFRAVEMGLQIEQRGGQLVLRGTLPPKPSSKRLQAHQQRISLGLPANSEGLNLAAQQAKLIAAQTIQASFNWQGYDAADVLSDRGGNKSDTWSDRIAAFEQHFWATRSKNASSRSTWETAYKPYLGKLVEIAEAKPRLSAAEQVYQTVLDTDGRSRSRQVCCTALKALCEFLDLAVPFDWQKLWGSYNQQSLQTRNLPDDKTIVNWYYQITHPGWQFVYGAIATYGLRNHEVFFCDYSDLKAGGQTITVLESTKTGSHEVWPFAPEWIDVFQLREQNILPAVNTDLASTTLQRIGQRVTRQFKRYDLPFSPYDLRHAWAVRTIHYGLPDAIAAQMMGHSLSIHTRTYQRWITHRDRARAVDDALQRRKSQER
ncbi:site-specific integrase [Pseudanabaena sp. PCC 6802]|uniref:site-specific integrase n=1 Tax=Pseudanabaena sp. PCC 6802 TaxID=118173 RepID=UPI000348DE6A|nr:site-specific integrase [Pseudanabaena sp. PCC 6802]